ncbi:MAG TPA: GNAT family N-acetyltransferase [Acidimicrobiales bacterium]|nr:GNAT family N-acetyltransferase [Acidimicrobiales bacterium]
MARDPERRIETERLLLRDLDVSDTEALIPAWGDEQVRRFMDDFGPRTEAEVREWVPHAIAATGADASSFGWVIVLKETGSTIGWIGFGGSSRGVADVDFAYVIAPAFRGRSYASEALRGVIQFCFDELEVQSVWGECAEDNQASARVMTAAGLTPIGVVENQRRFRVERF